MTAQSLIREIKKRGGIANLNETRGHYAGGKEYVHHEVIGELNGYDVHMNGVKSNYFTVRPITKRDFFDPGSDYNPGGYKFCYHLYELDELIY